MNNKEWEKNLKEMIGACRKWDKFITKVMLRKMDKRIKEIYKKREANHE